MRWWCKQGSMKTFSFFRKISLCVSRLDKSWKAIKITVKQIWCLKICANKLIYLSYLLCCICLLLFHPVKKKKKVVKIFWGFDPSWKEFFVKSLNQETIDMASYVGGYSPAKPWNPCNLATSDIHFKNDYDYDYVETWWISLEFIWQRPPQPLQPLQPCNFRGGGWYSPAHPATSATLQPLRNSNHNSAQPRNFWNLVTFENLLA